MKGASSLVVYWPGLSLEGIWTIISLPIIFLTRRSHQNKNCILLNRCIISEPWLGLNPRSRVAAPVVIGSSNVRVERNMIDNPESKYELGSHLIEPNTELDCRSNWLGHKNEKRVWERVFDRDDRYNLAKVSSPYQGHQLNVTIFGNSLTILFRANPGLLLKT